MLTAKDEKDIMLKILGVVDEFRESGVTCKNLDTETKNLANDNTLLQVGHMQTSNMAVARVRSADSRITL